ncbi:MAG: class I SAM-dependent methyltransferase [Acidimicrobiia bacterium]
MGNPVERPEYTFRDTPLAAERLLLVARVFESLSRSFLTEAVTQPPRVALDVGCGPGATTRLVAEVTGAKHTIGLDISPAFLELAAVDAPANISFAVHDVMQLPLPGAPVDLIYCRLLLAHVADVSGVVSGLVSQLAVGGRLLVDDLEWIDSEHPVLTAYERVVVDLVASRGAPMYAGPMADALRRGDGWEQRSSRVRAVPVTTADAARMFGMNLTTWRDDPHIREHYDRREIDALESDLARLRESPATGEITWGIRQVIYERTPNP